jgi:hypothetical protein
MKISPIILIVCVIFATSCFTQKDFVAEYDFNYNAGFKRYKTYGFVENPSTDTTEFLKTIERTISSRLGSQGFRLQEEKPDLLVNYKIFYEEVKYRGYEQPNFDNWLQRQGFEIIKKIEEEEDDEKNPENRSKEENYNNVKYTQNSGMLVIFVIDNKRGNTVWQGYTAAPFDYKSPDIQSDLTRATYRVMDQFRVLTRTF